MRHDQKLMRINDYLEELILKKLKNKSILQKEIKAKEDALAKDEITPYELADRLIKDNFPNL